MTHKLASFCFSSYRTVCPYLHLTAALSENWHDMSGVATFFWRNFSCPIFPIKNPKWLKDRIFFLNIIKLLLKMFLNEFWSCTLMYCICPTHSIQWREPGVCVCVCFFFMLLKKRPVYQGVSRVFSHVAKKNN